MENSPAPISVLALAHQSLSFLSPCLLPACASLVIPQLSLDVPGGDPAPLLLGGAVLEPHELHVEV